VLFEYHCMLPSPLWRACFVQFLLRPYFFFIGLSLKFVLRTSGETYKH
jgi:hypothetical protein